MNMKMNTVKIESGEGSFLPIKIEREYGAMPAAHL